MPKETSYFPTLVAICIGFLSGVASYLMLEPVDVVQQWLRGFLITDRVSIQVALALSAGLAFGVIGAGYLWGYIKAPRIGVLAFPVLSIIGMFCAAEVAIQVFVLTNESDVVNYVPAYLAASLVGAGVLMGGTVLTSRLGDARALILGGLGWPTLTSVITALLMVLVGTDDALLPPWSYFLFCGWQGAFLMVLSRARLRADA